MLHFIPQSQPTQEQLRADQGELNKEGLATKRRKGAKNKIREEKDLNKERLEVDEGRKSRIGTFFVLFVCFVSCELS